MVPLNGWHMQHHRTSAKGNMAAFEVPWAELQKVQEGDAMQTDVGAHGCCGLRGGAPRSKRKMQQDAACHTAREAKAKGASLTDSDSDDDGYICNWCYYNQTAELFATGRTIYCGCPKCTRHPASADVSACMKDFTCPCT